MNFIKLFGGNQKNIILLLICLAGAGLLSVYIGQDGNWDLRNYHIYNAWAFVNGRNNTDIFTAGIQTYFNPLLDLPYYYVIQHLNNFPRLAAAIAGIPYGLCLYLCILICRRIVEATRFGLYSKAIAIFLMVIFSITASGVYCEVGTTFNDILPSCFILLAIYLLLKLNDLDFRNLILSGLAVGLASGLKMTFCIYAPGLVIALFITQISLKRKFLASLYFCFAWLCAFLVIYGWWGYYLYSTTGNPFFPVFNFLSKTSWLGTDSGVVNRLLPTSFTMALFYPFYWTKLNNYIVEIPFSDLRYALCYILSVLGLLSFGFTYIIKYIIKNTLLEITLDKDEAFSKQAIFTSVFVFVSYLIWMAMFSNIRYAIPIECLLGAIAYFSSASMCRLYLLIYKINQYKQGDQTASAFISSAFERGNKFYKYSIIFTLLLITCISVSTGKKLSFERLNYSKELFSIQTPSLPENTQLIILGNQGAYLAPFISKKTRNIAFVGVTNSVIEAKEKGWPLWPIIKTRIQEYKGPQCLLVFPEYVYMLPALRDLGLDLEGDINYTISSNIDPNVQIGVFCIRKLDSNTPSYREDFNRHFLKMEKNLLIHNQAQYFKQGWSYDEKWFRWTVGKYSKMCFVIDKADKRITNITIKGMALGEQRIEIKLNSKILYAGAFKDNVVCKVNISEGLLLAGENIIEFYWLDSKKPNNGDDRELAFALEHIEFN